MMSINICGYQDIYSPDNYYIVLMSKIAPKVRIQSTESSSLNNIHKSSFLYIYTKLKLILLKINYLVIENHCIL